jgi:TrmH family RNA methyltransferase
MKLIESKENPALKEIIRIKHRHAKEPGAPIFIEGSRLCMDALQSGVVFETVIISRSTAAQMDLEPFGKEPEILVLPDHLFERISSTKNPQGLAAIVKSPVLFHQEDFIVRPQDKFLLCESIQDPGNMGGLIRTADAFGFDGILYTRDTVDPFNEKVLRSSMGSVFHVRLICMNSITDTIARMRKAGVTVYAAHLKGQDIKPDRAYHLPCALIMGNEGQGITQETADCCDELLRIPMKGKAESLNVSNAAAILCFLLSDRKA